MSSEILDVPGYVDVELVGTGGVGRVYRAVRASTGTYVALKALSDITEGSAVWTRVRRELEALASLKGHANVVQIEEIIETPSGPLLVMEYAPGGSVLDLIRAGGGTMDLGEAIFVCKQVAEALVAAHSIGVVHRDIKPQNLLVSSFGQIKVCDFGISALGWSDEFRNHTSALSYRYASPEELDGDPYVDASTDIYSLGATFVHCLAGRPPSFGGRDDTGSHRLEEIRGRWPEGVPGEATLIDLVRRCLALVPANRPTADQVLDELDGLEALLGTKVRRISTVTGGTSPLPLADDDLATRIRPARGSDTAPRPASPALIVDVPGATDPASPGDDATIVRPRQSVRTNDEPPSSGAAALDAPLLGEPGAETARPTHEPRTVEPVTEQANVAVPDWARAEQGTDPVPADGVAVVPVPVVENASEPLVIDPMDTSDLAATIARPAARRTSDAPPVRRRSTPVLVAAATGALALIALIVFVLGSGNDESQDQVSADSAPETSAEVVPTEATGGDDSPTTSVSVAPGSPSATLAFEPIVYGDGSSVERTWMVVLGDEPRLVGTLAVSAPPKKAAGAVHVEVIPKAVAADVADIDFSEEPSEVIAADPIVAFSLQGMKAGSTREITYIARLRDVASGDDPEAVLDALLDAQRRSQETYDRQQARRVIALTISPESNLLLPLQQVQLVVSGERADGKPVQAQSLEGVTWSSSDEAVAIVDRNGLVTTGNIGEARITVRSGELRASVVITVFPPPTTTTTRPPVSQTTRPPTQGTTATTAPSGPGPTIGDD